MQGYFTVKEFKASELIEDMSVYPRHGIDDAHVQRLIEAIRADEDLPPITICVKSKRIVDGFHRLKAHVIVHGEDARIQVVEKRYANDGELFADAVRLNTAHGKTIPLDDVDFIFRRAKAFGLDDLSVSRALRLTTERLSQLTTKRETVLKTARSEPVHRNYQRVMPKPEDAENFQPAHVTFHDDDNPTAAAIFHMEELVRLLKAGNVLNVDRTKELLAEIVDLAAERTGKVTAGFVRIKALGIIRKGAIRLDPLAKQLKVPACDLEPMLDHEWFTRTKEGYYLTPEGRNAVED